MKDTRKTETELLAAIRDAARQEQFLEVVSPEEAHKRFAANLDLSALPPETVSLDAVLGRVLAHDIAAPLDVPPFDRSGVDGFALRAEDIAKASEASPLKLCLNAEVIACGHAPVIEVGPGTASTIATGGMLPRGADAVVMIEQTELIEDKDGLFVELRRPAAAGQFVSYAGSDIARGETLLRRGTLIGSREIGMLAACGLAPGQTLKEAGIYDSNGAIIAAAITEAGGLPVPFGAFADDEKILQAAMRRALSECDMVILSGGTSKGAGDLSHRIVSQLGAPGILVHGVALKPGKPLCLAVIGNKPVVVLPGFPTSAIFTFHAFVAPVIRAFAGRPPEAAKSVTARVPVRIASEMGRKEFVLVSLVEGNEGAIAFPSPKGSGSVTAFSQAEGFLEIDALANMLDAGTKAHVTLIGESARAPDLVLTGSHDVALDIVVGALAEQGFSARTIAVGSQGGVGAAQRGECDLAPVHLVDPKTGIYNEHLLTPGLSLVKGWQRMQGFLFRPGDRRFEGQTAEQAVKAALTDPSCLMVNRNAGAGTRILIDRLLGGAKPKGYSNQPKSHNAVAAAIAQSRADWGIAIEPVARLYRLGFLSIAPEHYDFLLVEARRGRPAVQAFLATLKDERTRERIRSTGMQPA